jgi:hypothetical protein
MRTVRGFALLAIPIICLLSLAGCRSHFINITVKNTGTGELRNIEVRYPQASFGIANLAPQQTYTYKFQASGEGEMALTLIDAHGKQHNETGPALQKADEGTITLSIDSDGNNKWDTELRGSNERD